MAVKNKRTQKKPSRRKAAELAAQEEAKKAAAEKKKESAGLGKKIFIAVICAILAIAMTIPSLIMLFDFGA